MAELTIYDSQGHQIDDNGFASGDDRIKDFFFDGVRFAIDMLRKEAVCFFRARSDESSRSEQYYAEYNYANREELPDLPGRVEEVVEDEKGMILDNSQEDTRIFDLLTSTEAPELPFIDMDFRMDIEEISSHGQPIRLGVSSYDDAYSVIFDWLSDEGKRFAIAENATSSNLNGYDIVVDPTSSKEIEALGPTEEALETLRNRRRQQSLSGGGTQERSRFRQAGLALSVLLVVGGTIGLVLFASCTFASSSVPFSACGVISDGGGTQPALNITSVEPVADDSTSLAVNGTAEGFKTNTSLNATFELQRANALALGTNQSITSPQFNTTVTFSGSVQNRTALNVTSGPANDTYSFEPASTPTQTATETSTPEPTPSLTPTPNGNETTQTNSTASGTTQTTPAETGTNSGNSTTTG
jgi:hypothetical protein